MTWKEITEKAERYKAEGKSEQEVAELLRDDIGVFAKDCYNNPERMAELMPAIGETTKCNPIFSTLLFGIIGNGGWGR